MSYSKGDSFPVDESRKLKPVKKIELPRTGAARFLFVGLNRCVFALDRDTGEKIWEWQASKGGGFVTLHVDGDRLFVAVQGYTYAIDAKTGEELWHNPLKGKGIGITSLATVHGSSKAPSEQTTAIMSQG